MDARVLEIVCDELVDLVGPFAHILVDEHRHHATLEELMSALATEIGDPVQVLTFREQVKAKLRAAGIDPSR